MMSDRANDLNVQLNKLYRERDEAYREEDYDYADYLSEKIEARAIELDAIHDEQALNN